MPSAILSSCCPNYRVTYPLKSMASLLARFLLSNCAYHEIASCCASSCTPANAWRSLKWVVQPHVQIAIEEQLLPQQSRQRR